MWEMKSRRSHQKARPFTGPDQFKRPKTLQDIWFYDDYDGDDDDDLEFTDIRYVACVFKI